MKIFKIALSNVLTVLCFNLYGHSGMIDARDKFAANIVPQPKEVKALPSAEFLEIKPENIKIIYGDSSIKTKAGAEEINKQLSRIGIKQKIEIFPDSKFQAKSEKILIIIGNSDENKLSKKFLDKSINHKELKAIPKNSQGYSIDYVESPNGKAAIVIAGADSQGSLYGAVSLSQMLLKKKDKILIPPVSVKDWPDFKWRFLSSALTANFFYLANFSYKFANKPYIGDIAAGKEYIDWLLKNKINVARLANALTSNKATKEITRYAIERGIYTIICYPKPTISACSITEKKENASLYKGLDNIYRNKCCLSWSRDDLLIPQYRKFARKCKLNNIKFCFFHTADIGLTSLNYAQWKQRDILDRQNFGNNYGQADTHVISLIHKVFQEESPETSIIFVTYPYTAIVLEEDFPENIVGASSEFDTGAEKLFIKQYLNNFAKNAPDNFYTCLRETTRKNVKRWLEATQHPVMLYFETSKKGFSICNSRARFARTFYFKEYENMYYSGGSEYFFPGIESLANVLLHAEYSWNSNQDGSGLFENYYDFDADINKPPVIFKKIVPRCCRACWGINAGREFTHLFTAGISPGFIENPEEFSKTLNSRKKNWLACSGNKIEMKNTQIFIPYEKEIKNQSQKLAKAISQIKNWLDNDENKKSDPFSYKYGTMIYLFANYWHLKAELWLKYFNAYDFISRGQMLEARSEIDKGRQKLKDSTAAMKDIIKQLQDSHLCIVPMPRGVPVFKNMLASIKGMKNKYSELAGMTEHLEGKSLLLNKNKLNELKTRTYWAEKKGDMSWTKSPVYSDFIVYLSKPPILALDQTSVQIMYDSKNLYFKIVMNDKANKKPFTKNQNNSGANFWKKGLEENTAEIFICPPSLKNGFFQFACNPLGVKFSVININGKAKPNNCEWTVKTKQENGFWSAFITIPFCIFNSPPPQTGDSWKMGVARQQVKNNGNVTFSMLSPMMEDGLYPKLNFR